MNNYPSNAVPTSGITTTQHLQQQQQQQQPQSPTVVAGYTLTERLGSGSFAVVYKGVNVSTQDTAAIKAITRTSEKLTKKVLLNLELEISILRNYRHRNIVCMHQVLKTDEHFYMILEYCAGGDVQGLIRSRRAGRLSEGLTRRLMRDLAAGLFFLWKQQLIHRDIKPQNLLLTGPLPVDEEKDPDATEEKERARRLANFPTAQFCLKIADFGFARHLQTTSLAETLCGSPLYMAPEILQHHRYVRPATVLGARLTIQVPRLHIIILHRYDAKADLWSVGTVLFEMISGSPPFHGENHIDLLHNIQRKAVRLPKDVRVSKQCVTLLRILLSRNPVSRAGFKEFFEACSAFVALGCNGEATKDEGTCRRPNMEPIPENESKATAGATTTPEKVPIPPTSTFAPAPVPPAPSYVTQQRPARPNLLNQFAPPNHAPQEPGMISLPTISSKKMPQPIELPTRRNDEVPTSLQNCAPADDGSFVMVEVGGGGSHRKYPESTAVVSHYGSDLVPRRDAGIRNRLEPSPPASPGFFFPKSATPPPPTTTAPTTDYSFVRPIKGMLSTSPGTGGALMGMFTGQHKLTHTTTPQQQFETQITAATKLLATAEDVGRRAVCVAHLGDRRAFSAMRLVSEDRSGAVTPMEEDDDSVSCGSRQRRRSSSATDKTMADTKTALELEEEMPFAVQSEVKPIVAAAIPTRDVSDHTRDTTTMTTTTRVVDAKPTPEAIFQTFNEALTCYVKALAMLKGALGAAQGVGKDLQDIALGKLLTMDQRNYVNQMHKRSQVVLHWLGNQFKGVLGRGDAANTEIRNLAPTQGSVVMTSVEELLFQHSLGFGREGAVKQLLGHFEASRSSYRSAGLLAETLLMESKVQGDDRKVLEGYVDNFAARIRELDSLMMQESEGRMVGSSMSGSRRASPFPGQQNLTLTSHPSQSTSNPK